MSIINNSSIARNINNNYQRSFSLQNKVDEAMQAPGNLFLLGENEKASIINKNSILLASLSHLNSTQSEAMRQFIEGLSGKTVDKTV